MQVQASDETLLGDYARLGDERAFNQLVERHLGWIYGLASREIYDFRLAEEISQNVFSALATAVHQRRNIGKVSSWLYGATRKQIAQTMRSERRRKRREERAAACQAQAEEESAPNHWLDMVPQLNAALSKLSVNDQRVLFLRFYEDLTLPQLSEALEIKERAAQKRLQRAIERMRGLLKKRGVVLTASMLSGEMFTAGAAEPPAALAAKVSSTAQGLVMGKVATSLSVPTLAAGAGFVALIAAPTVYFWPSHSPHLSDGNAKETTSSARNSDTLPLTRSSVATMLAIDDIEGIYRLPETPRNRALTRLTEHLKECDDLPYLEDLMRRWSRLDSRRAASALVEVFDSTKDTALAEQVGELFTIPVSVWAAEDIDGLASWARMIPRTSYAEAFVSEAILMELAPTDLDAAWEWLSQRPFNRDRAYERLAKHLESTQGVQALTWLQNLPPDAAHTDIRTERAGLAVSQEADSARGALWAAVVRTLFADAQDPVIAWTRALPESAAAERAREALVEEWARHDPESVANWISTNDHSELAKAFARSWAMQDPAASLDWCFRVADEGLRWSLASETFAVWLDQEQPSAETIAWLEQLSEQELASDLFRQMVRALDQQEAVLWARQLEKGSNRSAALAESFYELGRHDAAKALRQASLLPQGEQREAYRMLGLGWLVSGGKQNLDEWQSTQPESSVALFGTLEAEVDLVASHQPNKAFALVEQLPRGSLRDPLVVRLIERTVGRSPADADRGLGWLELIASADRRRSTEQYVQEVISAHEEERLKERQLPDMESVSFKEQSLEQLLERLDYVSKRP